MLKIPGLPMWVRISVIAGILTWCIINTSLQAQSLKAASQEFTTITVNIPQPIKGGHLVFGIPLGSVKTPNHVSLYDESGNYVEADVFPLQNWQSRQAHWGLIAMPVSDTITGTRNYKITWDQLNPPFEAGIQMAEMSSGEIAIVNRYYDLRVGPQGITSIATPSSRLEKISWSPGVQLYDESSIRKATSVGEVRKIYNGNLYKKIRTISQIGKGITIHQEFDFLANSPYVKYQTRFINTSTEDLDLGSILPLDVQMKGANALAVGVGEDQAVPTSEFTLHQGSDDWLLALDNQTNIRGVTPFAREWTTIRLNNEVEVQWVFPYFQEMTAALTDRESILSLKNDRFYIQHYKPLSDGAEKNVKLKKGMARTFTHWMIFNSSEDQWTTQAASTSQMPYVVYDLEYLDGSGLSMPVGTQLEIDGKLATVQKSLEEIPYTTSIPEISNLYQIGGMSYGLNHPIHKTSQQGFILHTGEDITLDLIQAYLRSSDPRLGEAAYQHALLQADWGTLHYDQLASQGFDYQNPVAYASFEGLLWGYILWGDPWLLEAAQKQARAVNGRSGTISRGLSRGEDQSRDLSMGVEELIEHSATAISLIRMSDLTGDEQFRQTAAQMVNLLQLQQRESGSWVAHQTGNSILEEILTTAKVNNSLWPVYFRFKDEALKNALLKSTSWLSEQQNKLSDTYPGMFTANLDLGGQESDENWLIANALTASMASGLLQAFTASDKIKYFYASNAAWISSLNQRNTPTAYGASTIVTDLPRFVYLAGKRKLPALIGIDIPTELPIWIGMGPTTSWDGKRFALDLKWQLIPGKQITITSEQVMLKMLFTQGKPGQVLVNGNPVKFEFDKSNSLIEFEILLLQEKNIYRIEVATEDS